MKNTLLSLAWIALTSLLAIPGAFSIELGGAPARAATAVPSASWQSGTVVKVDAKSGELVLDGARRFTFSPGGGLIVRQPNGASASLADVKVGANVRLSVVRSSGYASAQVRELWFVE
jgi:hypothetical protein